MLGFLADAIHEKLAVRGYRIRGGEYIYFCIFHDDNKTPNLYVNYDKGVFYCFACSASGTTQMLASALGLVSSPVVAGEMERVRDIWSRSVPPSEAILGKVAKERGLKKETLLDAEVRVVDDSEFLNYLLFPLKTRSGALVSLYGYSLQPSSVKYKGIGGATIPYGLERIPLRLRPDGVGGRRVFIVEGIFDALSALEWGETAVALLGVSKYKQFFSSAVLPPLLYTYILAPDFDRVGQESLYKWALYASINGYDAAHVLVPKVSFSFKDFNDIHRSGLTVSIMLDKGLLDCEPVAFYLCRLFAERHEHPFCVALFSLLTFGGEFLSVLPSFYQNYVQLVAQMLTDALRSDEAHVLPQILHKRDLVVVLVAATTAAGRRILSKYLLPHEVTRLFSFLPIFVYDHYIPLFDAKEVERAAKALASAYRRGRQNSLLSLANYLRSFCYSRGSEMLGMEV